MKSLKIKAYAKINLTLEIEGVEGGYHILDSLVASIDLHDLIVLKKRKDKQSFITMKGLGSENILPESNNALKAANAFCEKYGCNGADITVYKNIPLGAGLGGSSADASGVLRGMAKLYGITDERGLESLAEGLGSDTKFMFHGGCARMRGRGETLDFQTVDEKLHFLLICPQSGVSAGACYRKYDELPRTLEWRESYTEGCLSAWKQKDKNGVGMYLTNDLYIPALHLNDEVQKAYEKAIALSPLGAVMTGSGSCVAALFENRESCEKAQSRYKGGFFTAVAETVNHQWENNGKRNAWRLE